MLSSISFFIYMRLGGVTYGASWLSWIGIFIKPCELCIGLLITPRSTVDPARTLNCFPLGGMIHRLVKTYMCAVRCGNHCASNPRKCLGILWLMLDKVSLIFVFVFIWGVLELNFCSCKSQLHCVPLDFELSFQSFSSLYNKLFSCQT